GLAILAGCSRRQYRVAADQNAYDLIAGKSFNPQWALPNWSIYSDPRSRYFDTYDADCPPMPPDDPTSHMFMREVAGMKGWKHWDDCGHRQCLDNPQWRQQLVEYARFTEQDEVLLDLDSSLQLAIVHSPSYQNQLETIYLSALDVSTERFRFEVQFYGGNTTRFDHLGRGVGSGLASNRGRGLGGARNRVPGERNTLDTDTDAWVQKQTATAGEILVGFANSFVWTFAGPNTSATGSLLNFNLVQPLLRGAGRDIALEQLTIVERGLLANLRAFQRYRHGFYTQVAVGELGVTGPQRRGGFFGGTGLTGFTGQGSGGLGGVGSATGFGRAGFGTTGGGGTGGGAGFAGGGAGEVGGFLGLLQQLQQIRNTRDSLALQVAQLEQLEAYQDAGLITLIQVDNFRQNIETERANLLQAENRFQATLDSFKTSTMGLPPDMPVSLDDSLIRQFQFLDPRLTELDRRLALLRSAVGDLPPAPAAADMLAIVQAARGIEEDVAAHFQNIDADYAMLDERTPARERGMNARELDQFRRDMQQERDKLADVKKRYATYLQQLDAIADAIESQPPAQSLPTLVEWLGSFDRLMEEASLVQARARVESVVLDPVKMAPLQALVIAESNRLDIMNNRAALVDSWRLIAFNADALQSDLSVNLHGDMTTTGDNPVKFQTPTGSLSASVQIDPPFTRLRERNNYRQSLIDYSQDRRQYIQFIDNIHLSLRNLLRTLLQLETNLEIQRRAVAISIRRVDLTRENLSQPKPPAAPGDPPAQFGDTAAQDLLTALSDLRNTQNNFMSVWLAHYAARMILQRDLGIMQLDENGRWIDQPLPTPNRGEFEQLELPPPVPDALIEQLNQAVAVMDRPVTQR
ncbi:MAG: TolC family protein, partial [Planctomycetes bacterium]|nr:TolC family protein [Planctomycetota bacterium]